MGCGSSTYNESESSTAHVGGIHPASGDGGYQRGRGRHGSGVIPPPDPAAYEEPNGPASGRGRPRRYVRAPDDDEDLDPNHPTEVTNKGDEMRTQHMGRVSSKLEARSSAKRNGPASRPQVPNGDLWQDDFTDMALDGADVTETIEWRRPSVS